jgi:peptidyl-prolyl cis-trans isomerase B (cyclophilin B)
MPAGATPTMRPAGRAASVERSAETSAHPCARKRQASRALEAALAAPAAPRSPAHRRGRIVHSSVTHKDPIMVELHTNHGIIKIELDAEKAPKSVENFLAYVKKGHYDGTVFHRVIDGFMIQGGGFEAGMKQKPTDAPIENEANNGLKNVHGSVAMARTNDPHSATAQFFINVNDNDFLNHSSPTPQGWGYAVFGKVVEGLDVLDAIRKVKTGSKGFHQDVPVDDVVIEKAVVAE